MPEANVAHVYPLGQREEHDINDEGTCHCGPEVQPTIDGELYGAVVKHRDLS